MKNNWYVFTGAPNSGKTTIIKLLEQKGYKVVYEVARVYIDQELAKGITIEEIRKDEVAFQKKILHLKIEYEKNLNPKEITFLDRALPDTIAYNKLLDLSEDKGLENLIKKFNYKKIFLFESLDYEKDYARTESKAEVLKLEKYLEEVYRKLSFPIIKVPVLDIEKRLNFILNNL